jgi:hypothetical protein
MFGFSSPLDTEIVVTKVRRARLGHDSPDSGTVTD